MWPLEADNTASDCVRQFDKHWRPVAENKAKRSVNILRPILRTYGRSLALTSLLKLLSTILTLSQPVILDRLITFLTATTEPDWVGYTYALLLFMCPVLASVLDAQHGYWCDVIGMRIRTSITSILYEKTIKLSSDGRKDITAGDLVNMISTDMKCIILFLSVYDTIWSSPLKLLVSISLLWAQLGAASLTGVIFMVVIVPINTYRNAIQGRLLAELQKLTACRVSVITEILNHIKVLKLYAWEQCFMDKVSTLRDREVEMLDRTIKTPIVVKNGSFKWDNNCNDSVLKNINITIDSKSLVAVVGRVGAGKSSLLSALLGDMERSEGSVNVSGRTAYCPQQAWIQNTTLRQNILFNSEYNPEYYDKVLDSCALRPDLSVISSEDMTEIGEKEINLSGGQKQRVSLARAVYSDADIYLLDDPLSAVDPHVGRHLFDQTIGPKGLLRHKTRVFVTNKASVLPEVDKIIVLKEGSVCDFGSFDELMAKSGEFAEFVAEYVIKQESEDIDEIEGQFLAKHRQTVNERRESHQSDAIENSVHRLRRQISGNDMNNPIGGHNGQQFDGKLIQNEEQAVPAAKMDAFQKYSQLIGYRWIVTIVVLYIVGNAGTVASGLWLSQWSTDAIGHDGSDQSWWRSHRLVMFAVFGLIEMQFIVGAQLVVSMGCVSAAKQLHSLMIEHTTPIGRTLNLFAEDMDLVDSGLFFNFRLTFINFFGVIVSLIMVSLKTPLILLAILPIIVVYVWCQRLYIASLRQLLHVETGARTHIISHFAEVYNGTAVIRAFGADRHFRRESRRRLDAHNACQYALLVSKRWLAVRLELLGYSIVLLSAVFAVAFRHTVDAGVAALAITYAVNITVVLGKLVMGVTDTETDIMAVESCLALTQIPVEAEWYIERTKLAANWPTIGCIEFTNYCTKYREGLDLVLKDIRIDMKGRQRVAIVGRTGAGKSSLALALFRLIEPTAGTVTIDGVDCSTIGLHDLRSKLTIIPQDPALFCGSLRYNLDPLVQYPDHKIWRALESAHLKTFVESLERGLNHDIAENGQNLSAGQKQLVCLARALLRRTRVLVMDEATAAIDMKTDDNIQRIIRQEFQFSTIITIAHRLNTIIDYNLVIVLNNGSIAESGTPEQLLADNTSIFYSMAKQEKLKCPKTDASFISRLTFSWFTPMIMNGYRNTLTAEDMWPLESDNTASDCVRQFNKHWRPIENKVKGKVNILRPILKTYGPSLALNSLLKLLSTLLTLSQPVILDRLIGFLTASGPTLATTEPDWVGYMYALLLFMCPVLASLLDTQHGYWCDVIGMRIRTSITSILYEKTVKLSSDGRKDITAGDVVNMISTDMTFITLFLSLYDIIWSSPLKLMVSLGLLWAQLGAASLAGVIVIAIIVPINTYRTAIKGRLLAELQKLTASRVSAITEILNHIKVLKLYAWEQCFMDKVSALRDREVEMLDQFIRTPIVVKNGSFNWDNNCNDSVLKNINIEINPQSLVAVVGRVGAGKSSLLSALLGDMEKSEGSVNVSGRTAYCPQQAWIQNTTLRHNILFNNELNEEFYNKVLDSCALRPDLSVLSAKDMTEIGEKGINLSGGQKQRVSLARAVYSDADIYLLDDPLSAVDPHVGRHLFDQTIGPKGLLRHKTRVFV
ncbi:unnamed protein product, partial [Medioppia subpectinata]